MICAKAPFMAVAPKSGAGTDDKAPIKLPIGVRAAATITTFLFMFVGFVLGSHFGREFNQIKLHPNGFGVKTKAITSYFEINGFKKNEKDFVLYQVDFK